MSYDELKYGKIRMNIPAGKGTIHRKTDFKEFDKNFDRIFRKDKDKIPPPNTQRTT